MLFCMGLSISRHHFRLFLFSLQNKHRCLPIFHFISEKCSIQQIKELLLPFFPAKSAVSQYVFRSVVWIVSPHTRLHLVCTKITMRTHFLFVCIHSEFSPFFAIFYLFWMTLIKNSMLRCAIKFWCRLHRWDVLDCYWLFVECREEKQRKQKKKLIQKKQTPKTWIKGARDLFVSTLDFVINDCINKL